MIALIALIAYIVAVIAVFLIDVCLKWKSSKAEKIYNKAVGLTANRGKFSYIKDGTVSTYDNTQLRVVYTFRSDRFDCFNFSKNIHITFNNAAVFEAEEVFVMQSKNGFGFVPITYVPGEWENVLDRLTKEG